MSQTLFTIVHEKRISVSVCDLCPTMDLVAIGDRSSGTIFVYRTLTWERVLTMSVDDMEGNRPSIVKWNSFGSLLAVAFGNGNQGVIDLETSMFSSAYKLDDNRPRNITGLTWTSYSQNNDLSTASSLRHSGTNIEKRVGMDIFPDAGATDQSKYNQLNSLASIAVLLMSISSDFCIKGHLFGIYPIFSVIMHPVLDFSTPTVKVKLLHSSGLLLIANEENFTSLTCASSMIYLTSYLTSNRLQGFQEQSIIMLNIETNLVKLLDSIQSFGKKWKEVTKVILPKLQLLQGVMDGYQLNMGPIEFMFSIATCGMWHPAATASFPNHWNEQGIARLRSGVESFLLSFIKYITMTAIPMVKNMMLNCSEFLGTMNHIIDSGSAATSSNSFDMIKDDIYMMLTILNMLSEKLENAMLEARLTQRNMMTFIQFIKENSKDTSNAAGIDNLPDFSTRREYANLFDPRIYRPECQGPHAQAEAVTGTFLFQYFQSEMSLDSKTSMHYAINHALKPFSKDSSILQTTKCMLEESKKNMLSQNLSKDGIRYGMNTREEAKTFSLIQLIKKSQEFRTRISTSNYKNTSNYWTQLLLEDNSIFASCPYRLICKDRCIQSRNNMIFSQAIENSETNSHESASSGKSSNLLILDVYLIDSGNANEMELVLTGRKMNEKGIHGSGWIWRISLTGTFKSKMHPIMQYIPSKSNSVSLLICGPTNDASVLLLSYALTFDDDNMMNIPENLNYPEDFRNIDQVIVMEGPTRSRVISSLLDVAVFEASGERGIVLLGDTNDHIVVIDIENDEEIDVEDVDEMDTSMR